MYIWELSDWPQFRWDQDRLANVLAEARHEQGRLLGRMEALGFQLREEAVLRTLTQDVLKSYVSEKARYEPERDSVVVMGTAWPVAP